MATTDYSKLFTTPGQTVLMYNKETGAPYQGTLAALASGSFTLDAPTQQQSPNVVNSPAANPINPTGVSAPKVAAPVYTSVQNNNLSQATNNGFPSYINNNQSVIDWGNSAGVSVQYDPTANLTYINGRAFAPNNVPGASFVDGHNYINDPTMFYNAIGYTPPVTTPAATDGNAGMDAFFNNFMNWLSPYLQQQSTEAPSFEDSVASVENYLSDLQADNLKQIDAGRDEAIKDMASYFAGRGMGISSAQDKRFEEIEADTADAKATSNANYTANVGQLAQQMYGNALSNYTSSNNSYNNMMINIGLAMMNGMIDMNKFVSDDAYRQTALGMLIGDNTLANYGIS